MLDASHRSSWNWSSYSNGTKSRVNRHLSEGTLGYLYHTASDQLEIGTSFAHDRYNYFGIYRPGLNPETEVGKRHTSPLEADEFYAQLALDYQKESDPWKFHLALHSDYTHLTPDSVRRVFHIPLLPIVLIFFFRAHSTIVSALYGTSGFSPKVPLQRMEAMPMELQRLIIKTSFCSTKTSFSIVNSLPLILV